VKELGDYIASHFENQVEQMEPSWRNSLASLLCKNTDLFFKLPNKLNGFVIWCLESERDHTNNPESMVSNNNTLESNYPQIQNHKLYLDLNEVKEEQEEDQQSESEEQNQIEVTY